MPHQLCLSWLRRRQRFPPRRRARQPRTDACRRHLLPILAAGLSRYSPTLEWLVPHFREMLYDNAELIRFWQLGFPSASGMICFRIRIEETVDWLLREMRVEAAPSAASRRRPRCEDGLFYTLSKGEIETALGYDSGVGFFFQVLLTLSSPHGWEGSRLPPNHAQHAKRGRPRETRPTQARLLAVREERVRQA